MVTMDFTKAIVALFVLLLISDEVINVRAGQVGDALGLAALGLTVCRLFGKDTSNKAANSPKKKTCSKDSQCDKGTSCFFAKRKCQPTPKGDQSQKFDEFCIHANDCTTGHECDAEYRICVKPVFSPCVPKSTDCGVGLACSPLKNMCLRVYAAQCKSNDECFVTANTKPTCHKIRGSSSKQTYCTL